MPLYQNSRILIRRNLRKIEKGKAVKPIVIGVLTEKQLNDINALRKQRNLAPIISEVLFVGRHAFESRVLKDGYTIDDVTDQICSGMDESSIVLSSGPMTSMQNPQPRQDPYGNTVNDRIIFECSLKHPRPEAWNVVPKGDKTRPPKRKEAILANGLSRKSNGSTG